MKMKDVRVPVGESSSDTAVLLLDAAEAKGEPYEVVRTTSQGYFLVPESVAKESGLDYGDDEDGPVKSDDAGVEAEAQRLAAHEAANEGLAERDGYRDGETDSEGLNMIDAPTESAPAKKAAAKKTTARKTAAKKTTAKKG